VLKATGLKAGVPDLMLILDGRIYFVELKEPGERNKKDGGLTPAQRETIPLLKRAGCPVAVVYSLDDLKALIAGPWWPLQACIREAKPATERIERGIVQPRDWPESDHLGRKRRAKG
jgi:hypothetical protein